MSDKENIHQNLIFKKKFISYFGYLILTGLYHIYIYTEIVCTSSDDILNYKIKSESFSTNKKVKDLLLHTVLYHH